jgi:cell division protein FtsL
MRLVNLVVIAALMLAAADVYRIKFDSILQGERLAKLRREIRQQRDAIANLRFEFFRLDNPARIEGLAKRHLPLQLEDPSQFDDFEQLPERPSEADGGDLIGAMIANPDGIATTGSLAAPKPPARTNGKAGGDMAIRAHR